MKNYKAKVKWFLLIICLVTVFGSSAAQAAAKPKLNKKSAQIYVGESVTLKVKNQGKNAVVWSSSKPSVAKVDINGKVAGLKKGTATIKAQIGKKTLKCTVSVKVRKIKTVKISKTKATLYVGKTLKLKTVVTPKNASIKSMTWKSSNKSIATVSKKGVVTPLKPGKVTISATTKDGTKKTVKCKVTVKKPAGFVAVQDVFVDGDETVYIGGQTTMIASAVPLNATNRKVKWTSSNSAVATVTQSGVVKGIKKGSATIKATATDGSGEYDWITVKVVKDPLAEIKKGLASAKKQGPEAYIKYCEQNLEYVDIGKYINRTTGVIGLNSNTVKVEADYGAAVEALYKPWLDQIYRRSYACYASSPLEKMVFINAYVSSMYNGYYYNGNRTRGWALCPSIANIIMGATINGSHLYGNCSAASELVIDMAEKELGLKGELVNYVSTTHLVAKITIGNNVYEFDGQTGGYWQEVNGQSKSIDDSAFLDHFYLLLEKYGDINYSPY